MKKFIHSVFHPSSTGGKRRLAVVASLIGLLTGLTFNVTFVEADHSESSKTSQTNEVKSSVP